MRLEGRNPEMIRACKICFLFITVKSIFIFLGKLNEIIPNGGINASLGHFFGVTMVQFYVAAVIALGIYLFIAKAEGGFLFSFRQDRMIRFTAGLLILIDGILNLSVRAAALIMNLLTYHKMTSGLDENTVVLLRNMIVLSIVPIAVCLLQILCGVYFMIHKAKKTGHTENEDNTQL